MKVKLYTLVDITESNVRRGQDRVAVGQQTNYDTVIQVLGLRSNPEPELLIAHDESISKLGFGSKYKGKHHYWEMEFSIPDDSNDIETLQSDFNLVPVITDLTETAKIDISVFNTNSDLCNIIFEILDK